MPDEIVLRPSVRQFAEMMEMTLRKHDRRKGGQESWRATPLSRLLQNVHIESGELFVEAFGVLPVGQAAVRIVEEAVDVANTAMMVADRVKPFPEVDRCG